MIKCPWCSKQIEVKSRTVVKKVIKPSSRAKLSSSPSKGEAKDKIEVVAPPAKAKAKAKAKERK